MNSHSTPPLQPEDSTVCFCHRQTLGDLRRVYAELGSLEKLQQATRVGLACGGCRVLLNHHFNENAVDIVDYSTERVAGATACFKPGDYTMKSFIIANHLLESRAFSCNAVPLQLGVCDASMEVVYSVYDPRGNEVLKRTQRVATGETFTFDTAIENLPRPFHGMIAYRIGRKNYGASRLNVAWYSGKSNTSTHENPTSGRPDVVLPIPVDRGFLKGPNRIYLAVQNPHPVRIKVSFRLFPLQGGNYYDPIELPPAGPRNLWNLREKITGWKTAPGAVERMWKIPSMGSLWIDANRELYAPALRRLGNVGLMLRMHTPSLDIHTAPSVYFFMHHVPRNVWSVNHL